MKYEGNFVPDLSMAGHGFRRNEIITVYDSDCDEDCTGHDASHSSSARGATGRATNLATGQPTNPATGQPTNPATGPTIEQASCSTHLVIHPPQQNEREISFMAQPYPGVNNIIREMYSRQSLDDDTINIMIQSPSQSALQQYNIAFELWFNFCQNNGLHFFQTSIKMLLQFLTYQFYRGVKCNQLRSFISALSFIFKNINENELICRFLTSVSKNKSHLPEPQLPQTRSSHDLSPVLIRLFDRTPNESLSVIDLSRKVAILLAFSTGQCVDTLANIKLNNITTGQLGERNIQITIKEFARTSAQGVTKRVTVPFLQNLDFCPVRALITYIRRTTHARHQPNTDNLFLTCVSPYRNATVSAISYWFKKKLSGSGTHASIYISKNATFSAMRAEVSQNFINTFTARSQLSSSQRATRQATQQHQVRQRH